MNALLMMTVMMLSVALTSSFPSQSILDDNDIISNEIEAEMDADKLADYLMYLLSVPSDADLPLVVLQDDYVQPAPAPISKRSRSLMGLEGKLTHFATVSRLFIASSAKDSSVNYALRYHHRNLDMNGNKVLAPITVPVYYRRYPWKRQQNGRAYEPDGYLCSPTRDDVFQLLMALHEARSGNIDKTVSFCNRKRPARAILTSMRFIGRR